MLRRALAAAAVAAPLGSAANGCVVTTSPSFTDQPSCPPSFLPSEASPPVNQIKTIDTSTSPAEFVATVPLQSCALAKTYQVNYFVDDGPVFLSRIDPTGDTVRSSTIRVPFLGVAPGCHIVEMLASTAFAPGEKRTPVTQGDVAYIWWYVNVPDPTTGAAGSLDTCPKPQAAGGSS